MFLKHIAAALRCFVFFEQKQVCSPAALFLVMDSGTSISPFSPVFGLLRSPEGTPFCDENASIEWTKIQLKSSNSWGYVLFAWICSISINQRSRFAGAILPNACCQVVAPSLGAEMGLAECRALCSASGACGGAESGSRKIFWVTHSFGYQFFHW